MGKKTENKVEADSITNSPIQQAENITNKTYNIIINQPAGEAKPVLPGKINNLPPRNINFTGRKDILDNLHKSLESGNDAALTQVMKGLGGVGKSQTALEYAYRYADNYDAIWWINAESFDTLFFCFAEFAHDSGLVDRNIIDRSIIVGSIKNWMAQNSRWLFIFDNAEKPEDIKDYIPGMSKGNILITSRFAGWRNYSEIGVDVFQPEDAADFLIKSTKIENRGGAEELAEELGYLPLALEQAAAYIVSSGSGYKAYLELYKKHRLEIFKGEMSRPKDYSSTIAVTWNITIQKIKNESALMLLCICSFFSGDGIDKSIFPACAECLPEPLASDVKEELKYIDIIYELSKYSLIKNQGSCFSIHRLLQEVVRDSLDKEEWLEVCLQIMHELFWYEPYKMEIWQQFYSLLKHALSIAGYAEKENVRMEEVGKIYNDSGMWLRRMAADYYQALTLSKKALNIANSVYGGEHKNLAAAYCNIGGIYEDQGDYEKALESYEEALRIGKKISGYFHISVATINNNIGVIHYKKGNYGKALEWYQKALEIKEKILEKEHPDVAMTYHNMAQIYTCEGDFERALEWHQKALAIDEKVLGKEHPDTAKDYNSIALIYYAQGKYEKALEWNQKALCIREKVFGKEHPETAISYENIALIYQKQGDCEKALELYERALKIKEVMLGKEHPETAITYNNIAGVYIGMGKNGRALRCFQRAIDIIEKVLGREHPLIAMSYNNIGGTYDNMGNHNKALECYINALEIQEKILGEEHPDIAATCNNIAVLYSNKMDYKTAIEWLTKAYKIYFKRQMTEYPNAKIILDTLHKTFITLGGKEQDFQKWLKDKLVEKDHE